jgi:tryptophan synthase alpha chain
MSDRLARRFRRLRAERRCGLVAYVTAGDPAPVSGNADLWLRWARAGADVIEVGIPAEEPSLDGAAIQAAHRRARQRNIGVDDVLRLVGEFRARDVETPLILMGYGATIADLAVDRFVAEAKSAGADGAIFIETPPTLAARLAEAAAACDLAAIPILHGWDEANWPRLLRSARGFAYLVASSGRTGGGVPDTALVAERLRRLRGITGLPIVAGFGVRKPEIFAALAPHADAIAVGTIFAEIIAAHLAADGSAGPVLDGAFCDVARRLVAAGVAKKGD